MFGRRSLIDSLFPLLFFDADGGGGGIGDVEDIPLGHSGDVSILERGSEDEGDGDDEEGDKSDKEEKDEEEVVEFGEEDEEDKEEKEDEEEEEEKDDKSSKKEKGEKEEDEEEEEVTPFEGRPTLTDIKTKYPKIFKEFPELREVLFRENEFTKQFGTVEEAQEAAVKARSYNVIEASLIGGDPSPIISQLAENDPEALAKVVDNWLPTLLKTSQDLYLRTAVPVIEQFLYSVHEEGRKRGDANLVRSAQHAANFIFGKPDIPDPNRRRGSDGPHPAEKKLEEERKQWNETRFREASSEVSEAVDTELKAEIVKGLDPQKLLNDWQREKLIEDILKEIDATLGKDDAFKRQMKALWSKAGAAGYPRDQKASIKSAFLARAKALVPAVRSRLRSKALGDKAPNSGGKDKEGKDKQQNPPKKRTLPDSGRAGGPGAKRPPSPRDVDWSKTTDEDLINGRYVRRR